MIKKEYYRLDELNKRFDVTFDDVRYWVEAGELNLAFHVNSKKLIIGELQNDKGFIAFGVANYSGLVLVSFNEQLKIVEKHCIKCRYLKPLNKNNITNLYFDNPFKTPLPNECLAEWQPRTMDQIEWNTTLAKTYPNEKYSALNSFGKLWLTARERSMKITDFTDEIATTEFDKYTFDFPDIEFTTKDICIRQSELIKLGVIESEDTQKNTLVDVSSNAVKAARTDDFNDLLLEIIHSQPEITAKQCWRIIEEENTTPEGSRIYDKYNLIKSISDADAIEWHDKKGQPRKSMLFATFSNRITRMKKLLFQSETSNFHS